MAFRSMAESIYFNKKQRTWVRESLEVAESLAADYFRVDLTDLDQFSYDLMTLAHLRGMEKTERALAQVCKYEYAVKKPVVKGKEFYRICLQDNRILRAAQSDFAVSLKPLLHYVVMHELIHVIRFSIDPGKFHCDSRQKRVEEKEVHRITHNCLQAFGDPKVIDLLERYRPLWDERADFMWAPLTSRAGVPNF